MTDIPGLPDDQFEFGLRTVKNAYRQKMEQLEQTLLSLKQLLRTKEAAIVEYQNKFIRLEQQLQDSQARAKKLEEEKAVIQKANQDLHLDLKVMKSELEKLFAFRRAILNTVQDDDVEDTPMRRLVTPSRMFSSARPQSPSLSHLPFTPISRGDESDPESLPQDDSEEPKLDSTDISPKTSPPQPLPHVITASNHRKITVLPEENDDEFQPPLVMMLPSLYPNKQTSNPDPAVKPQFFYLVPEGCQPSSHPLQKKTTKSVMIKPDPVVASR